MNVSILVVDDEPDIVDSQTCSGKPLWIIHLASSEPQP
jgi:hypothetical protein